MRIEGMMIDVHNLKLQKKPQASVSNNLKSKLLQALKNLEDLKSELE